jgi:4-hydroxy 2-oxovalerate aldolase
VDRHYLPDGGGSMIPGEVRERVAAVKDAVNVPIGLRMHNNLQLALANTIEYAYLLSEKKKRG